MKKFDKIDKIREKAISEGLNILFIGDSLTYYNDLPKLFEELAVSANKRVFVDSLTKGGTTVNMWWNTLDLRARVEEKIHCNDWDIIVFQPQRNESVMPEYFPNAPIEESDAAFELVSLIAKSGATPLQYSSFGVTKGGVTREGYTKTMSRREHTELVTEYNASVARRIGCEVVYVGRSFNRADEVCPEVDLYAADRVHPSLAGTFLGAASFFAVIFGEDPTGVACDCGLPSDVAKTLRKIASELIDPPYHK